nr:hypothetical protein Itr_chr09CG10410 [Ipomoea trifida]
MTMTMRSALSKSRRHNSTIREINAFYGGMAESSRAVDVETNQCPTTLPPVDEEVRPSGRGKSHQVVISSLFSSLSLTSLVDLVSPFRSFQPPRPFQSGF